MIARCSRLITYTQSRGQTLSARAKSYYAGAYILYAINALREKRDHAYPRISLLNCCVHDEVMLRSLIKSLRVVLIVVVLLTIYYAGYHLSESIFYGGRVAASYAGNNIIISNIMTTINSNKFDDNFLLVSNNSSKSILSSDLHPPDRSDINIYFTVKTTPRNYAKRIRPLQISWFQKVNKEMVSGARDSCLLSTTK